MNYPLSFRRCALVILLVSVMLSAMLTGCRPETAAEPNLLDGVPSSAEYIVSANLKKIMKNAGCRFRDNGEVVISEDLKKLFSDGDDDPMMKRLNDVAPLIDLSCVICFDKDRRHPVVTFAVTDSEGFRNYLDSKCEPEEMDGFYIYEDGGNAVVTDGLQGWAGDRATVLKAIADAGKSNAGIYSGVSGILQDERHTVSAVVNMAGNMGSMMQRTDKKNGCWAAMSLDLGENVLGYEIAVMDNDGVRECFDDYIDPVDIDFLRYVPGNANLVAAVGKVQNIDAIAALLTLFADSDVAQMMAVVLPYIKEIDGTTAVAVNPAASAENLRNSFPEGWDATVVTHMAQESVDNLISMGKLYAGTAGLNVKSGDSGFSLKIPDGNLTVNVEGCDGYLIASTREITGDCRNSFDQAFEGCLGGLVVDVPAGSETAKAFRLPYGFYFTAGVGNDSLSGIFRFAGSDLPLLATLVKCLADRR